MKRNFRLYALALVALLTGGVFFSACTTGDDGVIREDVFTLEPVKAPKIIAYSGTNYFGGKTRSSNTNANMWNQNWDCPPRPAEDLTPEELAELKALLSPGKYVENEVIIPFENYYVQQIYKGEDRYNTHDRCEQAGCNHVNSQEELGSGHMDLLLAYNEKLENEWDIYDRHKFNDGIYEHVKNFNDGNNTNTPGQCGCGESHFGTTLMTNMSTEGVTPNNQFGFHETFGTAPKYYNNYIIVEYKGYYYVGFDYEAHKNDQTTHNHGEGMDIERDWNFTDWIVRIVPAYHKGETPEGNPGGVPKEENPEGPEIIVPENPDPNFPVDPDGPEVKIPDELDPGFTVDPETPDQPGDDTPEWTDEVEVNLSLEEKDGYDSSHLSIHVRSLTDVDIFIPVPDDCLFENDDLMIARKKYENNDWVYGGPETVTFEVSGHVDGEDHTYFVTLNCEIKKDGIHIWTEGIAGNDASDCGIHGKECSTNVIDLCQKKFGDGLTFEIWNYFSLEGIDAIGGKDKLKEYLNQAIITFLDKEPEAYINAFMEGNDDDCTVGIHESQSGDYKEPEKGWHYNGSQYNDIYKKK